MKQNEMPRIHREEKNGRKNVNKNEKKAKRTKQYRI